MTCFRTRFLATFSCLILAANTQAGAALTFFPGDPDGWTTAVSNAGYAVEAFATDPNNVALANEVASPPGEGDDLGELLTFDQANTLLSGSFTFATQAQGQTLVYRDQVTGDFHPFDRPDAIEVNITDGGTLYAFALEIHDLESDSGDATVEIFSGATPLGSTDNLARAPATFFGVISDEPFDRITYSGTTVDGVPFGQESFANFQFAFAADCDPGILGDFNCDKRVDGDDLVLWQQSFGLDDGADADEDGDSDGRDFLIWQQNLGTDLNPPAVAAVPEPASIGLLVGAVLCLTRFQGQQR